MSRLASRRNLVILLLLLALIGGALLYGYLLDAKPSLEHRTLPTGEGLELAHPGGEVRQRVVLAAPDAQRLAENELLELAHSSHALIAQYSLAPGDCEAQQQRLQAAADSLGGPPNVVAGSGPGATLAWRWLARQNDDAATALSVDFSLAQPDCDGLLPQQHAHGRWQLAWKDNPDDASARFVRQQARTETLIGDYQTDAATLLREQLRRLLQGAANDLPVVEVPAQQARDTVSLFYSGDGGWRDLDRAAAEEMAKQGYPVVGVDTLRYFWQARSPEQAATDLSGLMRQYREKWGAKRFVLIGYSFGADIMPALYNRLPESDREQVEGIFLLALARTGSFEIRVQGWLGKDTGEIPTGPELAKLPPAKVLCIYGAQEADESGCTQPQAVGERLELPGGHHYDKDYPALAKRLMDAIEARQGTR